MGYAEKAWTNFIEAEDKAGIYEEINIKDFMKNQEGFTAYFENNGSTYFHFSDKTVYQIINEEN